MRFQSGRWVARSWQSAVASVSFMGSLYVLEVYGKPVLIYAATLQTCHERLAHVSKQGSLLTKREYAVHGVNLEHSSRSISASKAHSETRLDRNVCRACVLEKVARAVAPRARSTPRSACPLSLGDSGVYGLMQVLSVGGARYFVSFVDHCTSWASVQMPGHKSEAFRRYNLFKNRAELQKGGRVRVLRTDCGGEYLSDEANASLVAGCAQHQLTTAHSSHQNGVAERLNRTIMDLFRAPLAGKRVCKRLWAEAPATAVFVRTRVALKALTSDTTFYQLRIGRKPDTSHLRMFGCKSWYTLERSLPQRLDARLREARLSDYAVDSNAYKL